MHIKNDAKLAALLAASEARKRGESPAAAPQPWETRVVKHDRKIPSEVSVRGGASRFNLRILGVDTALRKTGWGIIDVRGKTWTAVDCGVVVNPPSVRLTDCLRHLNGAIKDLLTKYHPDAVAIEGGFYCKNARTAIVLGTARGAVLGVLSEAEVPVYEYAPRRAKQVVTGNGTATKEHVARMVSHLLRIQVGNLADDSTDALALAICHAAAVIDPTADLEEPL
ncbi:MAG: crossover junction endodeoxyribonuclease RuvC [Victivallales bacterium]|nr:crossover junction endodeoxyribonuclease RuvC [Victivallales bacterium]